MSLADVVYYCRVRTINSVQGVGQTAVHASGPWSLVRSFTVDTTPPPAPTLVAPKDWSATTSGHPTFSWAAPIGGKTYTLQIFNGLPLCTSSYLTVPNLTATSYVVPLPS